MLCRVSSRSGKWLLGVIVGWQFSVLLCGEHLRARQIHKAQQCGTRTFHDLSPSFRRLCHAHDTKNVSLAPSSPHVKACDVAGLSQSVSPHSGKKKREFLVRSRAVGWGSSTRRVGGLKTSFPPWKVRSLPLKHWENKHCPWDLPRILPGCPAPLGGEKFGLKRALKISHGRWGKTTPKFPTNLSFVCLSVFVYVCFVCVYIYLYVCLCVCWKPKKGGVS